MSWSAPRALTSDTARVTLVSLLPALFLPLVLAVSGAGVSAGLPYRRVADFVEVCRTTHSRSFCSCAATEFDKEVELAKFLRNDLRFLTTGSSALDELAEECPGGPKQNATDPKKNLAPVETRDARGDRRDTGERERSRNGRKASAGRPDRSPRDENRRDAG